MAKAKPIVPTNAKTPLDRGVVHTIERYVAEGDLDRAYSLAEQYIAQEGGSLE